MDELLLKYRQENAKKIGSYKSQTKVNTHETSLGRMTGSVALENDPKEIKAANRRAMNKMRKIAAKIIGRKDPKKRNRVELCGTLMRGNEVQIVKTENSMHYGGLVHCGNIWTCPPCAVKVSADRAKDVRTISKEAMEQGINQGFVTLTVHHARYHTAKELKDLVANTWREIKMTKKYKKAVKQYGHVGSIRALEVTINYQTGYHPHLHILLFNNCNDAELEQFAEILISLWQKIVSQTPVPGQLEMVKPEHPKKPKVVKRPKFEKFPKKPKTKNAEEIAEYDAEKEKYEKSKAEIIASYKAEKAIYNEAIISYLNEIDEYKQALSFYFEERRKLECYKMPTREGQDYKPIYDKATDQGKYTIGDYITKWDISKELTEGHIKQGKVSQRLGEQEEGKRPKGKTPFGILREMADEGEDSPNYKKNWVLFKEYYLAFKGARQLTYTKGMKLFLPLAKKDEDIANQKVDGETFTSIGKKLWGQILKINLESDLLSYAEFEGMEGIFKVLRRYSFYYKVVNNVIDLVK